jgi:hypothetical protein
MDLVGLENGKTTLENLAGMAGASPCPSGEST